MSIIEDIRDIKTIYGEPMERAVKKQLPKLEKHSRAFIALSPFIVMATCDAEGRCDASPKGDGPGFVQVLDDNTLLIPTGSATTGSTPSATSSKAPGSG